MKLTVRPSKLSGTVHIPASKSHTIRALFLATLASGESQILKPLLSRDTLAAADACRALGADIRGDSDWLVTGAAGRPAIPAEPIDVRNSGTTLRIAMSTAALTLGPVTLTGDEQIRTRPVGPLAEALEKLGVQAQTTGGKPPVIIRGPMRGGKTQLRAVSSQYLTSLLINCPFADADTEIEILELNEAPYVTMTLNWLDRLGLKYENHGMKRFRIPGGQGAAGFTARVPADFSSATFFLVAAAVTGGTVTLEGLDMNDTQGDKAVVSMLEQMGAKISIGDGAVTVSGGSLRGCEFDMNATPDALPAMAVAACFATGTTKLLNVPQARIKETDRIAVMHKELALMGGRVSELFDGLVIEGAPLKGAAVSGHHDHRIVMALAVAGLAAKGDTSISTTEAVDVTFPDFPALMQSIGAKISMNDEKKK